MRDDDFGARTEAVARLPAAAQRRRVILAMGVLRESRAMSSAKRAVSPTALCECCAETSGDDLPVMRVDTGSGQMQHNAPHLSVSQTASYIVWASGSERSTT
jgi:hypothetical protein